MDKTDMEGVLRTLLSTPQGAKVAGSMDKLKGFVDSPDGRALMQQLGGSGGDALKVAAQAAASGDRDGAAKLVQTLMSTPEGARLAMTLMNLLK